MPLRRLAALALGLLASASIAAAAATAAAAPPAGTLEHLTVLVAAALRREGYEPDADVVQTLAAVGAGYRKGPASDPPFLSAIDIDAEFAPELVQRYATGDRATLLDLRVHRPQVRATVDFNLDQLDLGSTGEVARETLTSLCLGSWDPTADEVAERQAIAGPVVSWYRAGQS